MHAVLRCPGDADRLDQRVRDRTGLLTAVNFSTGKDMPERHMFSFSEEGYPGSSQEDFYKFTIQMSY
ncbi:hypothetical protein CgunFtcFv8_016445 [Champsocephalus gunnari]|uniref:Uncharacterized protein n=1 Tax=Champsocephalus gunnari TaxID=52237 RepID=A0AAN8CS80_CHAGU|nr:hypothetical protein CgunFtcFv8_016445 [Champsocephalus gunnari]